MSINGGGLIPGYPNGDGTFTKPNGDIVDKWGNYWDPSTGTWLDPNRPEGGNIWEADRPGTKGIWGNGSQNAGLVLPSLGDGGGGSDNGAALAESARQFDATFTQDREQQEWKNNFDNANFNWQKAQDDRDYALALGDMELAKQKQADANYWQGKAYELDQQRLAADQAMNAADNSTRLQTAQIGAQAQISSANISAAAARYQADLQLQQGLANAHNDQERNKVMLAHEKEIANIAKMEDDTKRRIAAGEQKIGGFNAETARMTGMGDVALKNNQFILDASKSPRDLFGLYFMQRGITPDWDGLQQGNVTQGDPLKVYDPMKAYTPNITMPGNFDMAANGTQAAVGGATQNLGIASNPYLNMGMSQTQNQQQQIPRHAWGTEAMQGDTMIDRGGGGFTRERKFMTGDAPAANPWNGGARPEVVENPTGAPIKVKNTQQTALDFGVQSDNRNPWGMTPGQGNTVEGFEPIGNGAQPYDMPVFFPGWQLPIQPRGKGVVVGGGNQIDFGNDHILNGGGSPGGAPGGGQDIWNVDGISSNGIESQQFEGFDPIRQGVQPYNPHGFFPGGQPTVQPRPTPNGMLSGGNQIDFGNDNRLNGGASGAAGGAGGGQDIQKLIMEFIASMQQGQNFRMPRFAMGTNSFYQQNSQNDYLNGRENIPTWIQTLADYGAPIAPSLYDSVSGGTAPTLNMGNAFNQRGGGMLPSLQTLNKQTAGENQLFSGYVDGPVGMPSQDVIDFIGRPTQNLRTAQRSSATIM